MKIFVSYSYADRKYAELIMHALQKRDLDVFIDTKIPAGADLSEAVLNSLREADAVIFLLPREATSARAALYEVGAARALGKKIIALMPHGRDSDARDIAMGVADIIFIDVASKKPGEVADMVERFLHESPV